MGVRDLHWAGIAGFIYAFSRLCRCGSAPKLGRSHARGHVKNKKSSLKKTRGFFNCEYCLHHIKNAAKTGANAVAGDVCQPNPRSHRIFVAVAITHRVRCGKNSALNQPKISSENIFPPHAHPMHLSRCTLARSSLNNSHLGLQHKVSTWGHSVETFTHAT